MTPPLLHIHSSGIEWSMVRSSGPGGQHVNKVSSAVHLRFDIQKSDLKAEIKDKLLQITDHRMTTDGIFVIKAQSFRSQEQNKNEAIERLNLWIQKSCKTDKKRKPTRPTRSSQRKRLDSKKRNSLNKALRRERF